MKRGKSNKWAAPVLIVVVALILGFAVVPSSAKRQYLGGELGSLAPSFGGANDLIGEDLIKEELTEEELTEEEFEDFLKDLLDEEVCLDSDGGKNYYTKGVVEISGELYEDSCPGTYKLYKEPLIEYICIEFEDKLIKWKSHYACGNEGRVCDDGACVPKGEREFCTDTDGGKVFATKGTVTTNYGTFVDYCITGETLIEYYCGSRPDGTKFHEIKTYSCGDDLCIEGKCVGAV